MRRPLPLARARDADSSPAVSLESLTNLYAEPAPKGSPVPYTVRHTPGLKKRGSAGSGPIRGIIMMRGELYVVSGAELYVVDQAFNAEYLGPIAGFGPVRTTHNGTHVAIATNTVAYAVNRSEVVTLGQSNLNGADYQDGYGIFTQRNTQFFWLSNIDDMTTIGGLDFTSADAESDNVQNCLVNNEELLIFKERTLEQWYNAGASPFPYVRSQNGVIERGTASGGSVAQADRSAIFVGDDLRVYLMQGLQPRPISTPDIERLIQSQTTTTCEAFAYEQQGQLFYVLSFPALTVVYSLTTGLWHLRRSEGTQGRWRAQGYAYFYNRHIVGDFENGNLYELDLETFDEDGEAIVRTMVAPPVYAGGRPGFMGDLLIEAEGGVGLTSGQGSDPELMLDYSDDLGKTWSSELRAKLGPKGAYSQQAAFLRLGRFEKIRHLRLSVSDPVPVHWLAMYASIEAGS